MPKTTVIAVFVTFAALSTTALADSCSSQNNARNSCMNRCENGRPDLPRNYTVAQSVYAQRAVERCNDGCPSECVRREAPAGYGSGRGAR